MTLVLAAIREAFDRLFASYGPQDWWPAATRKGRAEAWEILVGAVLVQHTSWRHVVTAIRKIETADMMSVEAIHACDPARLADLIRPAGPQRVKAQRLQSLTGFLVESFDGSVEELLAGVEDRRVALERRKQLLGVKGIGPETADAILLYAGGAPVFVVDAYKRRVMRRHGWGDPRASYDEVANFWRRRLPNHAGVYDEAHALLVNVGVEHCRSPTPRCEGCPLQAMLPNGGPLPDRA